MGIASGLTPRPLSSPSYAVRRSSKRWAETRAARVRTAEKKKKPGRSEEGPDPQQRRRSGVGMVGGGERWGRPARGCRSPKHVQAEKQDRGWAGIGAGQGLGLAAEKGGGEAGQLALGGHL